MRVDGQNAHRACQGPRGQPEVGEMKWFGIQSGAREKEEKEVAAEDG